MLLRKRGLCVIDSIGDGNKAGCRAIDTHQARSSRGMWQRTPGDEPLNMDGFILSLTLKKKKTERSSIHATIRVVKAEMLERALSLWMYVSLACPVTLSRSVPTSAIWVTVKFIRPSAAANLQIETATSALIQQLFPYLMFTAVQKQMLRC